ncbi:MAG: UDP-N-acetylglucosamine 2-epimerase (non-hydrolyzing) [Bacteroidota bacterium]|nr:UDP-N-acetylglucosamine 2-epimerase (non-hydrolyzing) [Bacteroidota bacterium]
MKKKTYKIISVIGARPQFIKASPIELAFSKFENVEFYSIHTGQHYDENMSQIFFNQLNLKKPYKTLESGGKSHAKQTADILIGIEELLIEIMPDLIIVYGDTNSTIGAALAAAKLHIPIAHIEAGLRSFNKQMPEEVNRILTDHISDLLFVPSETALNQLASEGINQDVYLCGDVMKDIMNICLEQKIVPAQNNKNYYYTTIHRPYNTDNKDRLLHILNTLNTLDKPVIFSIHPRTLNLLKNSYQIDLNFNNIAFIEPQGYFDNLAYLKNCDCVITDSGGMQKEAYWLKRKCITIRKETEWTETLENGCNTLVFDNLSEIQKIISDTNIQFDDTLYGTANASEIIAEKTMAYLYKK